MSRMIDRLYADGFWMRTALDEPPRHMTVDELTINNSEVSVFGKETAFVVDNVTEYLFAETDQECWTFEKDFPCVMLPFPDVWMETRPPSRMYSSETGVRIPTEYPRTWGILLHAERFGEGTAPSRSQALAFLQNNLQANRADIMAIMARIEARSRELGRRLTPQDCSTDEWSIVEWIQTVVALNTKTDAEWEHLLTPAGFQAVLPDADPAWVVYGLLFANYTGEIHGPMAQLTFMVDTSGRVIPMPRAKFKQYLQWFSFVHLSMESMNVLVDELGAMCFPFWLALSFCHCKNVIVTPQHHTIRGKPQRYHGRPRVVYHTLNITPMRRVLSTEGHEKTVGLARALSICRGHFKDYAQGKGLFGKLHGLYWWESHLRGNAEAGMHVHDYAVHGPHEGAQP